MNLCSLEDRYRHFGGNLSLHLRFHIAEHRVHCYEAYAMKLLQYYKFHDDDDDDYDADDDAVCVMTGP